MIKTVIIDDMLQNCKLVSSILKQEGNDSVFYTNSNEALEYIKTLNNPVMIIMDWVMPELSGIEICRILRETQSEYPIYIILFTARTTTKDLTEGFDAGANDFVKKPFSKNELKARYDAGIRILKLEEKLIEQRKVVEKSLDIIRKDVNAGKIVQQKMLPPQPFEFKEYHFSYFFHPSLYLSGDFLDYFILDENNIGFYFADVAGHGASSAFITIILKNYISNFISGYKSQSNKYALDPAYVISEVNRKLINENLGKHLVMIYGIINTENNTLTYSNGGQFPPLFIADKNNNVQTEIIKGMSVGLFKGAKYFSKIVVLPEKFKLLIYSDGIIELFRKKDDIETIIEKLKRITAKNTSSITELQDKFKLDNCENLVDDVTIMKISKGEL